jgi:hypothetical protein
MHEGAGRKAEHAGGVRVKFAEGEGREAERRGRRESLGQGEGEFCAPDSVSRHLST